MIWFHVSLHELLLCFLVLLYITIENEKYCDTDGMAINDMTVSTLVPFIVGLVDRLTVSTCVDIGGNGDDDTCAAAGVGMTDESGTKAGTGVGAAATDVRVGAVVVADSGAGAMAAITNGNDGDAVDVDDDDMDTRAAMGSPLIGNNDDDDPPRFAFDDVINGNGADAGTAAGGE
jgi:hypothetical protein